jgi:hypothetical protein
VKNLGGYKAAILRGAQNDKNSLLIAHWYKNRQLERIYGKRCIGAVR